MRLPQFSKTQKKIAIGAGAGVGVLALTWFALRPKKSSTSGGGGGMVSQRTNIAAPAQVAKSRVAKKGQRVIAWPKDSDKNGLAYIKFVDQSGVNGGWIDEMTVLRDSEVNPGTAPAAITLRGVGALVVQQSQQSQESVAPSLSSTPNAVILKDTFMYMSPDDPKKIAAAQDFVFKLFQGRFVLVSPDSYRFWAERDGISRALALIGYIWGNDFSADKIKNGLGTLAKQSTCQTIAAAVTVQGAAWEDYKLHACYNISAQDHPAEWWQCFIDSWNKGVDASIAKWSLFNNLSNLGLGPGAPTFPMSGAGSDLCAIEGTPEQIDTLANFAKGFFEYGNKEKPGSIKPPDPPDPALGPLGENMYKTAMASLGMGIAERFIKILSLHEGETLDGAKNPCIRELNFDLVLEMAINTIGIVFSLATAGVTTALGAAFQIAKVIQAIAKLGELSQ